MIRGASAAGGGARVVRTAMLAILAAGPAGCGKPVLRIADASLGDYYTEKEFRKLSREQREDYCRELTRQDSLYRAEVAETRAILGEIAGRITALRAEEDSLRQLASALEAEAAPSRIASRRTAAAGGTGPARHRVRPGDSLWRISALEQVFGNGARWPELYAANRNMVRDPDLIHPGEELIIPR